MHLEEFEYTLPAELIAQRPLAERDASRMMVLHRAAKQWEDTSFGEIPQLLQPDDLLVFNNTKVFPARLLGRRRGITAQPVGKNNPSQRGFLTGETELLLTRQESEDIWQGLVHPGRKVRTGEVLLFGDNELEAEILGRGEYGVRRARLRARTGTIEEALDRVGHVPLPPYIHRHDEPNDRATYQTVYAKVRGAVAAPTAGLHFTQRVLSALAARGVETCEITLHVGLGTFQPVRVKQIEDHHMEAERYEVSEAAAVAINRALDERRRVIAVGTTSVRTLESVAREHGGRITPGRGETRLFIIPGFPFRVVGGLLTNFHLPQSTLLMLVSAFAEKDFVLSAYRHAVEARYRFYSYGDCMLIL
ncbi:MAG: tRNA preQ1(34) S-adenosylmethionine ribosyltransferase-isomerase QueA [Terriglobia bacterium]|jgi:S-adenosylmethionine:tRNA ribosyltransferase-isomerase